MGRSVVEEKKERKVTRMSESDADFFPSPTERLGKPARTLFETYSIIFSLTGVVLTKGTFSFCCDIIKLQSPKKSVLQSCVCSL